MDADVVSHCLLLQVAAALSRADCCRLLSRFPSTRACLTAGAEEWRSTGLSMPAVDALQRARDGWHGERGAPLRRLRQHLAGLDVAAVTLCDSAYPPLLRVIDSPPPFLYVRGSPAALSRPQLAVVGSRGPAPWVRAPPAAWPVMSPRRVSALPAGSRWVSTAPRIAVPSMQVVSLLP